jgi:hypothetical protein
MKNRTAFSIAMLLANMGSTSSHADEATEKLATEMLFDVCPRLVKLQNASELVGLTAKRMPVEALAEQDLGWKEIVQVRVELASPLKSIPSDFYAAGHICRYDIGNSGVVTAKSPCKKICDFEATKSGAAYLGLSASTSLRLASD